MSVCREFQVLTGGVPTEKHVNVLLQKWFGSLQKKELLSEFWETHLSSSKVVASVKSLSNAQVEALSVFISDAQRIVKLLSLLPTNTLQYLRQERTKLFPLFQSSSSVMDSQVFFDVAESISTASIMIQLTYFLFAAKKVDDFIQTHSKRLMVRDAKSAQALQKIGRVFPTQTAFAFTSKSILGNAAYQTELLLLLAKTPSPPNDLLQTITAHIQLFEDSQSPSNYIRMIQLAHNAECIKAQKTESANTIALSRSSTFLHKFNQIPIPPQIKTFIEIQYGEIPPKSSSLDTIMKAFNGSRLYDAIQSLLSYQASHHKASKHQTEDTKDGESQANHGAQQSEDILFVIDSEGQQPEPQSIAPTDEDATQATNDISLDITNMLENIQPLPEDVHEEIEDAQEHHEEPSQAPNAPSQEATNATEVAEATITNTTITATPKKTPGRNRRQSTPHAIPPPERPSPIATRSHDRRSVATPSGKGAAAQTEETKTRASGAETPGPELRKRGRPPVSAQKKEEPAKETTTKKRK